MLRLAQMAGIALIAWTLTGIAAPAFAAGWSFSVDAPLQYTFDKTEANKQLAGSNKMVTYNSRSTERVSGSKVTLIAPFHVGVGYEDYSVNQNVQINGTCSGKCMTHLNLRMVDLLADIPLGPIHLGLGVGMGTADEDAITPQGSVTAHGAEASQVFATLGIALGPRSDLHLGYHRVTVEEKALNTGAGAVTDKILASGDMLSAGLRLNF